METNTTYEILIKKSLDNRIQSNGLYQVGPHWNSSFFGLDNISYFNELSLEKKNEISILCSQAITEEAMHIELRGIDFTTKIISKAQSLEEKLNYSLIHADEVEHYFGVKKFLHFKEKNESENVFINLLKDVIASSDEYLMVFFVQIVLEGWGMTHYRDLYQHCLNEDYKAFLKRIHIDESRHHAAGLVHYSNRAQPSSAQVATMKELLVRFLDMIRIGPQTFVGCLEKVVGGFSLDQKTKVFEQINPVMNTGRTLLGIKRLLRHDLNNSLIDELDKMKMFEPLNPSQCSGICLS